MIVRLVSFFNDLFYFVSVLYWVQSENMLSWIELNWIESTKRFSLTSPSLAPRPLSMQIYSRDKGTKMAINLTKNRDSLLKTWKNVFDDTPDVNWWDLWLSHTFLSFTLR